MALTIGEVAKASGVAAKTFRYHEQIGVSCVPCADAALAVVREMVARLDARG
jgi:hypothetical protein